MVPAPIRDFARETRRKRRFSDALSAYRSAEPDQLPSRQILQKLIEGWGNEGFSAEYEYLQKIIELARTADAPVVECGSGLSTILIGLELQRRNQILFSLEHHSDWAGRVRREVANARLKNVKLCEVPLCSFGAYSWYDLSQTPLPDQFAFVICDGPPGDTPGHRYGLLPILEPKLRTGCVIVLDDYQRAEERAVAARWVEEYGLGISDGGFDKPYALLTVP